MALKNIEISTEMEMKLFDLLISLGFTKCETEKHIYFKNKNEVFVFPHELYAHHYIATRKQLDMNGWINYDDFNKILGI